MIVDDCKVHIQRKNMEFVITAKIWLKFDQNSYLILSDYISPIYYPIASKFHIRAGQNCYCGPSRDVFFEWAKIFGQKLLFALISSFLMFFIQNFSGEIHFTLRTSVLKHVMIGQSNEQLWSKDCFCSWRYPWATFFHYYTVYQFSV